MMRITAPIAPKGFLFTKRQHSAGKTATIRSERLGGRQFDRLGWSGFPVRL